MGLFDFRLVRRLYAKAVNQGVLQDVQSGVMTWVDMEGLFTYNRGNGGSLESLVGIDSFSCTVLGCQDVKQQLSRFKILNGPVGH